MTTVAGWIPVALSPSLEPGTSTGTVVDGAEVVVWRDNRGNAHVWEDRCPHRGMRMSFGFVRGDHIACLYHGWQYDTAGQCRYVPAHPDLEVPATIKIQTYVVAEKNGIVWTSLSSEAPLAEVPVTGGDVTPVRTIHIDRPAAEILAALETTALPAFSGTQAETESTAVSETVFTLSNGDDTLLIALQRSGPARTALHIVIQGLPEIYRGPGQKHFARWAEALRFELENPAPADLAEVA